MFTNIFVHVADHAENYLSNPVLQTALLVLKSTNPQLADQACQTVMTNTGMWKVQVSSVDMAVPTQTR